MENNALAVQIQQTNLSHDMAELLQKSFLPFYEQADKWMASAKTIQVTDISQTKEMKQARDARIALKDVRVAVEKKRKELKDESLKTGQAIDKVAKTLKELIEPIEAHLQEQEDFAEVQEAKRIAILDEERIKILLPYVIEESDLAAMKLGAMGEQQFNAILLGYKTQQENKIAEAKKIEDDRIAKEKADAEAREQQRLENERLKSENKAKEKLLAEERAKAEAERKALEAKAQLEREVALAEQKKIQDAADKEAKRLKDISDANIKKMRDAQAKVEAELKVKQDAENKRIAEEEKARKEKLASEKKAAKAPDKIKLLAFSNKVSEMSNGLSLDDLKSDEARKILSDAIGLIVKVSQFIDEKANQL